MGHWFSDTGNIAQELERMGLNAFLAEHDGRNRHVDETFEEYRRAAEETSAAKNVLMHWLLFQKLLQTCLGYVLFRISFVYEALSLYIFLSLHNKTKYVKLRAKGVQQFRVHIVTTGGFLI